MSDEINELKARLQTELDQGGVVPEDFDIESLDDSARAAMELAEAKDVLKEWRAWGGERVLGAEPEQMVLEACGVTRTYFERLLLDALPNAPVASERRAPVATVRCSEADVDPPIEVVPIAGSRLAVAHGWHPDLARPVTIAGDVVASHLASRLHTSEEVGSWLWRSECKLLAKSPGDFAALFAGLDIEPGYKDSFQVALAD